MKNLRTSETWNSRVCLLQLLLALFTFTAASAQNDSTAWKDYVRTKIDSFLTDEIFQTSQVGICIYDITDNSLVYSHNSRQTMRPASTEKLITAITALDVLGADHKIYTSFKYDGEIKNKTLEGKLYCKGHFDPLFSMRDLNDMVERIKESGIDTIRGYLYIDKSMKDNHLLGAGWCWDDENPVLSPLTVNGNDDFNVRIEHALKKADIFTDLQLGFETCPNDAEVLCDTFRTLKDVLPEMMKESDNFFAESMFYNLAASAKKKHASAKDAIGQIKELAKRIGYSDSQYRIADGSGLSLYNYLTPMFEVDFLCYAFSKKDIIDYLYPALPIAGVDGTLKKRMKDCIYTKGNVHAKTGSVSGVSSLAGYCNAPNGHVLAFSIINQGMLRSRNARIFQDKVCTVLCEPFNQTHK